MPLRPSKKLSDKVAKQYRAKGYSPARARKVGDAVAYKTARRQEVAKKRTAKRKAK